MCSESPRPNPNSTRMGWKFYPNKDYFGNDINGGPTWPDSNRYQNLQHIRSIAKKAERTNGAVAFNSIGCIKRNLNGQLASVDNWTTEVTLLRGLFCLDETVPYGWIFFPDRDSFGNDKMQFHYAPTELWRIVMKAKELKCPAFNTEGWIKNSLVPHEQIYATTNGLGLYVRID
jgi:hypothetical protein